MGDFLEEKNIACAKVIRNSIYLRLICTSEEKIHCFRFNEQQLFTYEYQANFNEFHWAFSRIEIG